MAQAYPRPGAANWSDDWSRNWKSNLPDPYRDDLTSDGDDPVFAIGSANGRGLKFPEKVLRLV